MANNFDVHFVDDHPPYIGICCYDWAGVKSSTRNFCPNRIETRAVHYSRSDEERLTIYRELVDIILSTGCDRIVVSGFVLDYASLFQVLKERKFTNVALLWPGTIMEMGNSYTHDAFMMVRDLYDDGLIKVIGFVKKGFDVVCDVLGFDTYHIPNFYDAKPYASSGFDDGLSHIGIFQAYDAWYKHPYAMLAATKLIPNSVVHLHGGQKKGFAPFLELMDIQPFGGHQNRIAHDRMPKVLSSMDIVLYVTFCEGTPMLPLESLSVGTPCLLGPSSNLFLTEYSEKDYASEYLYDTLVVPHPDDSEMIAEYAIRALDNKRRIIEHYEHFAVGYNSWCKQEFVKFIDMI